MKSITSIIGIILIIFGIVTLGYTGFTYTSREKVAQVGSVQVTADTEKTVVIPPLVSGLSLLAGIALVAFARMGNPKM